MDLFPGAGVWGEAYLSCRAFLPLEISFAAIMPF
jgi:hypothetical protein